MTTAMALGPAPGGKPLYLFGWPFPVPAAEERADEDESAVLAAVASGRVEREQVAAWGRCARLRRHLRRLRRRSPSVSYEVQCRSVCSCAQTALLSPTATLVDSSGSLPVRVILRITPCEAAIVSVEDRDLCFTALPFNDLAAWEVKVWGEVL